MIISKSRREFQILIGIFILFTLNAVGMAQSQVIPEQWVQGDQLIWRTLSLETVPPPDREIQNIRRAIEGRTTIRLGREQEFVRLSQSKLTEYPFLHFPLCEDPPNLDLQARWRWRDYFASGGTLFLDHCSTQTPAREQAWLEWSQELYPEANWETMSRSHVLSYSFYLLEKRMLLGNEGVPIRLLEQNDRFIMIWNRSERFAWQTLQRRPVSINPNPGEIETSLRFYVNLMMYLLAGDYKTDQLHLPTILLRRK